jgi:predicted kinase
MPTLHFVAGKAGAGKTTLARQIASEHPAVFFSEDEWLFHLAEPIESLDQYIAAARRVRRILSPLIADVLRCGASVVLDFGGNTVRERAWVRSIFDGAGAAHLLHHIEATESECLARVHQRNEARPEGVYFGHVTDEQVAEVNKYFAEPSANEGFTVMLHRLDPAH